jgi:hypothetical protein
LAPYDSRDGQEEIHLPGPSLLPAFTAVGITVTLLGLIYSWWIVAAGLVVTLICLVRWIRTVRDDIDALPAERPRG